jgi:hypothetical protein
MTAADTQPAAHRARPGGVLPAGPELGPRRQGTWFHRDPLGMTRARHARYGDLFRLRRPTEGTTVVCAPGAVRELLEADPAYARTGEPRPERMVVLVPHRSGLVLAG